MQTSKVHGLSIKKSITSHDHKQERQLTPPNINTIPLEMQSVFVSKALNREAPRLQNLEDLAIKSQGELVGSGLNFDQRNSLEHQQTVILFHVYGLSFSLNFM